MNASAAGWFDAIPPRWRHGLQLALAVLLAFGASASLRLPEHFWAVMSALIVVRPNTGSTLGAGWDRVKGTLSGTVFGLAGVWLHHTQVASSYAMLATLSIVAALALASAVVPGLRSAPISALIILDSSGIAGRSALAVAGLRAVEIGVGVAAGIAVSLVAFASDARGEFDAACARWLRDAATRVHDDVLGIGVPPDDRAEAIRKALREIGVLAVGADREQALLRRIARLRRREPVGPAIDRVAIGRLLLRLSSDLTALVRTVTTAPHAVAPAQRARIAEACLRALGTSADRIDRDGGLDLQPLRALSSADAADAWTAPTARLVVQDLAQLRRLYGAPESA